MGRLTGREALDIVALWRTSTYLSREFRTTWDTHIFIHLLTGQEGYIQTAIIALLSKSLKCFLWLYIGTATPRDQGPGLILEEDEEIQKE